MPEEFLLWRSGLRIWCCCSCGIGCSSAPVQSLAGELPYASGVAKKKKEKKKKKANLRKIRIYLVLRFKAFFTGILVVLEHRYVFYINLACSCKHLSPCLTVSFLRVGLIHHIPAPSVTGRSSVPTDTLAASRWGH